MCYVQDQIAAYANNEELLCPDCGYELVEKHIAFESPWYECPAINSCGYSFDPNEVECD